MSTTVSIGERIGDEEEQQRRALENASANMRVAMPGEIVAFNAIKQTATVQPLIKERINGKWEQLPQLLDVPCCFPRAGGYCLTFPVKPKDECLIIFNDMCLDAWWQSGGIQAQLETRRHDLSDAVAILGITSVPHAVKDYAADSVMLRNEDMDSYIQIKDGKKTVNIIGAENINITAESDINIDARHINVKAQDIQCTATNIIKLAVGGTMIMIQNNGITVKGNINQNGTHTDNVGPHCSC